MDSDNRFWDIHMTLLMLIAAIAVVWGLAGGLK